MILCRLDYWLISNNLQDLVAKTVITLAIKSDTGRTILIERSINESISKTLIQDSGVLEQGILCIP